MTRHPTLSPGTSEIYDLSRLSDLNYRRHRTLRYVIAGIGVISPLCLVAFTWETTATATPGLLAPGRLVFMAAALVVGYFCLGLAWIPFRLMARPPVSITVSYHGIDLAMLDGKVYHIDWAERRLAGELLLRDTDSSVAPESRFRLLIGHGGYDYRAPWRWIPPAAYLTEACARMILEFAQAAHVNIERIERPHPASLVRSKSMTAYLFSNTIL
jgi:hypothetical protein